MKISALFLLSTATLTAADVNTFSIVAYDPVNGDWGVTVASRYFSVGAVVPWAEAGVGAVATQANVNVGYGPRGLELLRQGLSAKEVLDRLMAEDKFEGKDGRQVAIVDRNGGIAAYTGPKAQSWAGDKQGKYWSAQGNILAGPQVVNAMGQAFESTNGELAEKLYAALKAGDEAGGDARGKQSASMLVVRKGGGRNINNDRYIYINVDDNPAPLTELRRLLDMNLAYLYQDKTFKLIGADQMKQARDAAASAVRYAPTRPDAHVTLGMLDYVAGDKAGALMEFRKAREIDPNIRKQMEAMAGYRPAMKAILDDKEFLKQVFPEQ
jgi:uncharacterized Ntn-hydrolase superfamily protein